MVVEPISMITLIASLGACLSAVIDKCFGGCRKSRCSEVHICCCDFKRNVPDSDEEIK